MSKKSKWFEGFLTAEEYFKDDWTTNGIRQEFFYAEDNEFINGVFDYCNMIDKREAEKK